MAVVSYQIEGIISALRENNLLQTCLSVWNQTRVLFKLGKWDFNRSCPLSFPTEDEAGISFSWRCVSAANNPWDLRGIIWPLEGSYIFPCNVIETYSG